MSRVFKLFFRFYMKSSKLFFPSISIFYSLALTRTCILFLSLALFFLSFFLLYSFFISFYMLPSVFFFLPFFSLFCLLMLCGFPILTMYIYTVHCKCTLYSLHVYFILKNLGVLNILLLVPCLTIIQSKIKTI